MTDTLLTVGDLVRWGASRLNASGRHFGHGTDNAADEARLLVFHALSLDFNVPEYFYVSRVTPAERADVIALIDERITRGCPAAYLTGVAWFCGLRFEVNESVLVPRSPIAELIGTGFEPWLTPGRIRRVLDLGTGSGCLAIAIAAALDAHVDAVDISADALEVARRNVSFHGLEDRVTLYEADLYGAVAGRRYDLIVSNPPYVGDASMASLPDEYACEPEVALAADDDGLAVVKRILADAAAYLESDGLLVVEVGESAPLLAAQYPDVAFEWVELAHGGDGVFVLTAAQLAAANLTGRCA